MKTIATIGMLAFLAAAGSAIASDAVVEAPLGKAPNLYVYQPTGETAGDPALLPTLVPVVAYENTASPANVATSSTNLSTTWGDRVTTTGTGTVEEQAITVFNSASSNTGLLLTASVEVRYYNAATAALLGGYNGNVNFGAGLNPGFYSTVTWTGLSGLNINLTTTDVLVTQKISSFTGTTIRLGVASLTPVTVGSSGVEFYKNDPSAPPAGYYTFSGGAVPAQIGYRIALAPVPVPAEGKTWSAIKALYN